jgi:2-hydroxychromene-2-carboxylate isomerase
MPFWVHIMSKTFGYYFVLNSPWSFLAATQLPADVKHCP